MSISKTLPASWSEVSLATWLEWEEIKGDPDASSLDMEAIALFKDITLEDPYFDQSIDEILPDIRKTKFVHESPTGLEWAEWNEWKLLHPNDLTLGEFIDMENWCRDTSENLTLILALMLRKWSTNEWGHLIYEPYGFNPEVRRKEFTEIPITSAIWVLETWFKWREAFLKEFAPLFAPNEEEVDQLEETENARQQVANKIAQRQAENAKAWSWQRLIWDLAGGNLVQIKPLTEVSVVLVFKLLAMKHSLEL
jgi:hypothetical protein